MKKVIIIGSNRPSDKNDPSIIKRALGSSKDLEVMGWNWEDLLFDISTDDLRVTHKGQDLIRTGAGLIICFGWYKNGPLSIYRDVAYSLALVLKHNNISFWNSEMLHQRSSTKLSCMVKLALSGVSVPRTVFSLTKQNVLNILPLPCIVKAASASRGKLNYLVGSEEDMNVLVEDDKFYIAQPYLPNDHDLRVICFDGQPKAVLKRTRSANQATHLNNTSNGSMAAWMDTPDMPAGLLTEAQNICTTMNREMAGIDFIPDIASKTGYSCLEVNAIPQLTSGFDFERKMSYLVEAVNSKGKEFI